MKIKYALFTAILTLMLAVSSHAVAVRYTQEAPPPRIKETYTAKPGYVWSPGYYTWDSAKKSYKWNAGKHLKARKDQVYMPNRWVKSSKGWTLVEGKWVERKHVAAPRKDVGKKKNTATKTSADKKHVKQAKGKNPADKARVHKTGMNKTCTVKRGYKIGYWKSEYDDYNFGKKR
jgi:hypothetical protein